MHFGIKTGDHIKILFSFLTKFILFAAIQSICLFTCVSAYAGVNEWTRFDGLGGGDIQSIAVAPSNDQIVYAGVNTGGIYTSADGGATWSAHETALSDLDDTEFKAIAIHPTDPDIAWVGVYYSGSDSFAPEGVYKTTDGGATWIAANSGITDTDISNLTIPVGAADTLYAASYGGGVYKTTDGGATWAAANSGITNLTVHAIEVHPVIAGMLYAGTSGGFFQSEDGGATWITNNDLSGEMVTAIAVCANGAATRIYAGVNSEGIATLDSASVASANWSMASNDSTLRWPRAIAVHPTDPDTVFVQSKYGVTKTTNAFSTLVTCYPSPDYVETNSLTMDPSDPNTLFAGTQQGVFKSADSGVTWISSSKGMNELQLRAAAISRADPNTIYAGAKLGVFKSTDGGTAWTPIIGAQEMIQDIAVHPINENVLYAAGSVGILQTLNGGDTWSGTGSGWMTELAMNPQNPTVLYAAQEYSGLLRTDNAGASWTGVSGVSDSITAIAFAPTNPDIVYLSNRDGICRTGDGGDSWTNPDNYSAWSLAVHPASADILFKGKLDGIWKSVDAGASWSQQLLLFSMDTTVKALAIHPINTQIMYAGIAVPEEASSPGVPSAWCLRSMDGGQSWQPFDGGNFTSVRDLEIDPGNPDRLFAATDDGLFVYEHAGPANDHLADATAIASLPASLSQNTAHASAEADESAGTCSGGDDFQSIWYQLTPDMSGALSVDASASDFTPLVSVWTGSAHPLTEIGCDYNALAVSVSAGTPHYIRIAGPDGASGNLSLNVSLSVIVAAPSDLSGSADQTSVSLTWTDNSDNETGFKIQRSADSGASWADVTTTAANETAFIDSGLSPNTAFQYRVAATTGDADSGWSDVFSVSTLDYPAPAKPAITAVTAMSQTSLRLLWTDADANESGFELYRRQGSADWNLLATLPADTISHMDAGLSCGETYDYRLRAVNAGAASDYSASAGGTTLACVPDAPSDLTANPGASGSVSLTWTDNSDNESGFIIERLVSGGEWERVATPPANAVSAVDADTSCETMYIYHIAAAGDGGDSPWSDLEIFSTGTCAAPLATGNAALLSCSSAALSGEVLSDDAGAPGERGVEIGGIRHPAATGGMGEFTVTVTGLTSHTDYSWRAYVIAGGSIRYGETTSFRTDLPGDINDDCAADLADVVAALQICGGITVSGITLEGDADGNGRIGLEDAVFLLREISR